MQECSFSQQVRAARGWLGWSRKKLSREANLHYNTLKYLESNAHQRDPMIDTIRAIREAIDRHGVEMRADGVFTKTVVKSGNHA